MTTRPGSENNLAYKGRRVLGLLLIVATLLALPEVLFRAFTGMSWFDDEGTIMVSFRALREGHRMYDDIYSLYGPLYNEFYGFIYAVLRIPLTHTISRLIAAAAWLAITAGFAAYCYRITQSTLATICSYVFVLNFLRVLMDSPGHPEELCLLLLATTLLLACAIERARDAAAFVCLGAVIAGLALVKINIGVFVGGGVALALLLNTAPSAWTRIATPVVTLGLLVLPFAIEGLLWDFWWVKLYSIFSFLVIAAALLVCLATPQQTILRPADWWILAGGAGLGGLVIVGGMMLTGTSAYAILDAVVLQNAHFLRNWYVPLQTLPIGLSSAAISVVTAVTYYVCISRPHLHYYLDPGIVILKSGFVLLGIVLLHSPPLEFQVLVPFCWLLMVQHPGTEPPHVVSRGAGGLVGAAMSLYPFPVAGHQVNVAALMPIVMIPVLARDIIKALRRNEPVARAIAAPRFAFLVVGGVLGLGVAGTVQSAREYFRRVPLGLPGTDLIRASEQHVDDLRWVTAQLASCSSFYSIPGMWSFAFWSGHALLTTQNINDVLAFIPPAQQQIIVQIISRQSDLCVVYNPTYLQLFDRGQIRSDPPLLHYVKTALVAVAEHDGFVILRQRTSTQWP